MDIELKHIHKRFGRIHANNDITMTLQGGRIIGILGENGAGKSTLMKILSGFQPADSGDILVDGRIVNYTGPQAAIAQGIGMLQQDPLDVPAFTVLENFMFGAPRQWSRTDGRSKLSEFSQQFDFDLHPETPIEHLSIAQRQQLEIARLLALGVKTLILDEPTTGISAEQKDVLFDALRDLAQEQGMTVLLVSHKLEDVIALCDEVKVLRAGRLEGGKVKPKSTQELVGLMFGQELATEEHAAVQLGETVLTLDDLELISDRLHIEHLTVELRAGEVVGLAGLDGSGQELMMRACVGLLRPVSGRIRVGSADLTGRPYRDYLHNNVVFSAAGRLEEGLIAGLTLTEHVALVTETNMMVDWERAGDHTAAQLERYNVRGKPDDNIEQLSGGNQQRVLMALMPQTPVAMILEQPTRGLDVDSARWIWQQLLARRAGGTAIIFSSAELDELVTYSDRLLVFYAGRVYVVPDADRTNIDELGLVIGGDFSAIDAVEQIS